MRAVVLLAALLGLAAPGEAMFSGELKHPVFPFLAKSAMFPTCRDILFNVIDNTPGLTISPQTVATSGHNCLKFVGKFKKADKTVLMDSCKEFQGVLAASLDIAFKQPAVVKKAKKGKAGAQKVAEQFCGYFAAADSHLTKTSLLDYLPDADRQSICLATVGLGTEKEQRKFTCEGALREGFQQYQMPTDVVPDACAQFLKVAEESEKTGTFGEGGTAFCSWAEEKSAWHAPFSAGEQSIEQFFAPTEAPPTPAPQVETADSSVSMDVFADKIRHAYRSPTDAFWAMGGNLETEKLSLDKFWPVCKIKLEMKKADCVAVFNKIDFSEDGVDTGEVSLKEWLDNIGMGVADLRALMESKMGGVDSVFHSADLDGDGILSRKDFVDAVMAKPLDVSEANANKLFDLLDQPNHDGKLTEEEFTDHLGVTRTELAVRIHRNYGSLDSAFKALDSSKDGALDAAELATMYDNLKVPAEDRDKLTRALDINGDGKVTEEELLRALPVDGKELRFRIYEHPELGGPSDAFDHMDTSHNEQINVQEFEKGVEVYTVTKVDADAIFHSADKVKDDVLTRDEFYKVVGYEPEVLVPKLAHGNAPFGTIVPWGKCAGGCVKNDVPEEGRRVAAKAAAPATVHADHADHEDGDEEEEAEVTEAPVETHVEAPSAAPAAKHDAKADAHPAPAPAKEDAHKAEAAPAKADAHAEAPAKVEAPAAKADAHAAPAAQDAHAAPAHAFVRRSVLRATK